MAGLRADTGNPMHISVAPPAVEQEPGELPLQVALRGEQLYPQALGREHGGAIVGEAGRVELPDQRVGVPGVLCDGVDGPLQDLSLSPAKRHGAIVDTRAWQASLADEKMRR
jgi:hypothetical protein